MKDFTMLDEEQYDDAAEYMARYGRLPIVSNAVQEMIDIDPQAFQQRVNDCLYAIEMEKIHTKHGDNE